MVRKKLDERVRTLLERSVAKNTRSLLVLVGDHGKDQVPNLHYLLSKTKFTRPSVLWCYKKELGFSTHRKKRMKKLKRLKGLSQKEEMDNFELFMSQTNINWCYYKDTHRVLGSTVGMLVLQDFEALTPNILARTIETVEGGGVVVFLLKSVSSLKQLYAMSMDVHARYRTESSGDVVPRFNERFILSLGKNTSCLVCDDELNVLPLSKAALKKLGNASVIEKQDSGNVAPHEIPEQQQLKELQESLQDTPHISVLVNKAKTLDQAKALLVFLEACCEKSAKSTIAMTAARGRGKSAAMGLCLAGAISFGYSNISVTAPTPENLVAVFDFVLRGLQALKYQEHLDYTIVYNNVTREQEKCIVAIHVHKSHRQVIQYMEPTKTDQFASAELVAIDEAAAIPLPIVKKLMNKGDRLVFLSSTVNGYEGTGRALSLKLIKELRESKGRGSVAVLEAKQASDAIVGPKSNKGGAKVHEQRWAAAAAAAATSTTSSSGGLREIELLTPIRYASGDAIEAWLNKLLCLDSSSNATQLSGGAPAPSDCELYSVDRDALFSHHKLSEAFLQKLMGLYTSAHYKNSPNDLQMLSDAPAHSVYCLLAPPSKSSDNKLPDVLAVVQVALEGKISRKAVEAQLARGHRSAGDLIPWTVSQQFGDSKFAQLSGARIVRIAVHPSVQSMGYGSRAVELLYRFYNGEMISLTNEDSDDSEEEEEAENAAETDSESIKSVNDDFDTKKMGGIRGEKLTPRKELPPLLLPLTEVDAPRLDWIGTSFGLTEQLHKFWTRAGMRMLYLRQTTNELTGEHSAIMLRALPKRTGVDDGWLPAFMGDTQRRFIALLGGPFQDMSVRLAISVLGSLNDGTGASSNNAAVDKRSGSMSEKIGVTELNYFLTPHDLKRLELYGRNLCDHHLVTDLLPAIARLYFTSRFGSEFKLSSLQAALLCGIGLQNRSVDSLTAELGLPPNQVLAMFNKGVRKMSIALNAILEESEKANLLGGEERQKVELAAKKMQTVSRQTLQEDAEEAAKTAMAKLSNSNLPPEVMHDDEIMQFAVKGSDEQWSSALKDKEVDGTGTVQIRSVQEKPTGKRKLDNEDIEKEAGMLTPKGEKKSKSKKSKKSSTKKSSKKNRA